MTEYRVLPLTEEHWSAAALLERDCFGEEITAQAFGRFASAPANHYFCVVNETGEMMGYGGISLVADEAEIITVAVAPLYRRRGIARCLMEHMLRLADQTRASVYLEVRESNIPARNLYAALGFSDAGVRKNYYTSPRENAVLMMRVPGAEETLSC